MCMANTKPIVDNEETLRYVLEEGKKTGIHVLSCAAISKGFEGKERTDMEGLLKAGAAGFTDDGIPLMDGPFVKEAMEEAARLDTVLSFHEEDKTFIKQNGINHGKVSDQLGIYGSPALAEDSPGSKRLYDRTGYRRKDRYPAYQFRSFCGNGPSGKEDGGSCMG